MYLYDESVTPYLVQNYIQVGYKQADDQIPSLPGLAEFLGSTTEEVSEWDDPAYLRQLCALQDKQQQIILNKGLTGSFNSTVVKLVLAKHGFSERTEVHQTGETTVTHREIVKDMDPKEASRVYDDMLLRPKPAPLKSVK